MERGCPRKLHIRGIIIRCISKLATGSDASPEADVDVREEGEHIDDDSWNFYFQQMVDTTVACGESPLTISWYTTAHPPSDVAARFAITNELHAYGQAMEWEHGHPHDKDVLENSTVEAIFQQMYGLWKMCPG